MNIKEINNLVSELGRKCLEMNKSEFESEVKSKIQNNPITPNNLNYLKKKLHNLPEDFPEVSQLGQNLALGQYVIFEIIFNTGAIALDLLKEIAFGGYDWTQANALETLCRLYVENEIHENIIEEINNKIGNMMYETHLYFAKALLSRARKNFKYFKIINSITDDEFQEVVLELKE